VLSNKAYWGKKLKTRSIARSNVRICKILFIMTTVANILVETMLRGLLHYIVVYSAYIA